MSSIESGPEYLTLLESIADTRAGDREQRRITRVQRRQERRSTPDSEQEQPPVAVSVSGSLYLLPISPRANWRYNMNRDIFQVGRPEAWGERTDLMEIYRKYRKSDTGSITEE